MTWWFYTSWGRTVSPVEVERYNDKSVWIKGKVCRRISDCCRYFPTRDEAFDSLLARVQAELRSSHNRVNSLQKTIDRIEQERQDGDA